MIQSLSLSQSGVVEGGAVSLFAGSGVTGYNLGSGETAQFVAPCAVCIDPTQPDSFYLSDQSSIRHFNRSSGKMSLVAGGRYTGRGDGYGSDALFRCPVDLLITSDGAMIWIADSGNGLLRRLVVSNGRVTTPRDGGVRMIFTAPSQLAFDRFSPPPAANSSSKSHAPPESALLIASSSGIVRYDTRCAKQTIISAASAARGIQCLVTGQILFSTADGIYCLDRDTKYTTLLVPGPFKSLRLAEQAKSARCLFAVNADVQAGANTGSHRLQRIDLPPAYLPLPYCCDRDN